MQWINVLPEGCEDMAIDLPSSFETIVNIDWDMVKGKVQDYAPVIDVIKNTWTHETLKEIIDGKVFVSDDIINDVLKKNITEGSQITALKITSKETGTLDIYGETKNLGRVELSGTIEECIHNEKGTYVSYHVRERELKDHGLGSWIFSRISISMTQKITGGLKFSDNVPTKIHGNTIRVDLTKIVNESDFGTTEFHGYRLADMVEIEGAKPKAGGIELDTKLNVPDEIKALLIGILK